MPPVSGALTTSLALARNGTRAIACSSVRAIVVLVRLASGHLGLFDDPVAEIDQAAAQDALAVLAARIDAGGTADLDLALGFVDVPVQAEHGLVFLNGLAHGGAARAGVHHLAAAHDRRRRIGAPIELGAQVERGVDRRHMEIEDGALEIADLRAHLFDNLAQLLVGDLTWSLPRGRVAEAHARHAMHLVNGHDLGFASDEGFEVQPLDRIENLGVIVVAAGAEHTDAGPLEAGL